MTQSDQVVTARIVLQTQLELQRLGIHKAMTLLESTEPDMTEFLLENSTALYHRILKTTASPREARRIHNDAVTLVLVCIRSLQKAHATLWQEDAGEGAVVAPPPDSPLEQTP